MAQQLANHLLYCIYHKYLHIICIWYAFDILICKNELFVATLMNHWCTYLLIVSKDDLHRPCCERTANLLRPSLVY